MTKDLTNKYEKELVSREKELMREVYKKNYYKKTMNY